MNITMPAPSSVDPPSSLTYPSSSDAVTPKDAAPPIGSAANGTLLWRSILDAHGREILECATDKFLDLARALRLEAISRESSILMLAEYLCTV
jgi:hypothetical protein